MSKPPNKKPPSSPPKEAKTRKAEFDRRMRNVGRKVVPDEPERFASVLFLSANAKKELERNRAASRVVGGRLTDSKYIESLLHERAEAVDAGGVTSRLYGGEEYPPEYRAILDTARSLHGKLLAAEDERDGQRARYNRIVDELPWSVSGAHEDARFSEFEDLVAAVEALLPKYGSDRMKFKHELHRAVGRYLSSFDWDAIFGEADC